MYARMHTCICAWMHGCVDAWMHACVHRCMHAWVHACMHVCMLARLVPLDDLAHDADVEGPAAEVRHHRVLDCRRHPLLGSCRVPPPPRSISGLVRVLEISVSTQCTPPGLQTPVKSLMIILILIHVL